MEVLDIAYLTPTLADALPNVSRHAINMG